MVKPLTFTKVSSYEGRILLRIYELGVYHESQPLTLKLGVGDRVRLYVVFVRAVHSGTSAVMAVVGDGRSATPVCVLTKKTHC